MSEDNDKKSVVDTLDLARGEVNEEDVNALEEAIDQLDFATHKASPEHLARLEVLCARMQDVVQQIREGKRKPQELRQELTEEQLDRYTRLVDQGVDAGERGNLQEASELLEEAVRLNPEGVGGLFNLGVVYGLLAHKNITTAEFYDDYVRDEVFVEKAQICYDHVLELEPDHLPSLNNLATLCSIRDNREGAVAYLKRIIAIEPSNDIGRHIIREARSQLSELESI